jgi:hypothetical protein
VLLSACQFLAFPEHFYHIVVGDMCILLGGVAVVAAWIDLVVLGSRGEETIESFPACAKCGYNLTGSASPICPECGHPHGDVEPGQRSRRVRSRGEKLGWYVLGSGLLLVLLGALVLGWVYLQSRRPRPTPVVPPPPGFAAVVRRTSNNRSFCLLLLSTVRYD